MKNHILKVIIFIFLYSNVYAGSPITVYNDSNLDLYFESDRAGCSGYCYNPWTGAGVAWGSCCGDTAGIVKGKTYSSDPSQTGTINLNSGAPAWTSLGYNYAVHARSQDGKDWLSFTEHSPGSTLRFPGDFNVSADTLTTITPPQKFTQAPIDTLGFLVNLVNSSSINFMIQGHPIPAQATLDTSSWQSPSSKFPDLWDNNKNIQITGQLGNLNRTITLTPTAHSLTIQDQFSGQNVSPITTTQLLDLDSVISDYIGQISSSNVILGWGISLKFTDQDVQITDIQIQHEYATRGIFPGMEAYWIYPDKVLKKIFISNWTTITGKPTLSKYIHKQ